MGHFPLFHTLADHSPLGTPANPFPPPQVGCQGPGTTALVLHPTAPTPSSPVPQTPFATTDIIPLHPRPRGAHATHPSAMLLPKPTSPSPHAFPSSHTAAHSTFTHSHVSHSPHALHMPMPSPMTGATAPHPTITATHHNPHFIPVSGYPRVSRTFPLLLHPLTYITPSPLLILHAPPPFPTSLLPNRAPPPPVPAPGLW